MTNAFRTNSEFTAKARGAQRNSSADGADNADGRKTNSIGSLLIRDIGEIRGSISPSPSVCICVHPWPKSSLLRGSVPAPASQSSVLSPQSSRRSRGFTLVEVMLSLFIALLLLYGMNRLFGDTARAIQAGNAGADATRNGRAVAPIIFDDLRSCAADSPAFIISSNLVPQYLSATDAKASGSTPLIADTTYTDNSGCLLGDHLHRADSVSFFARGLFQRKTANSGFTVSTTTSNEAFIHYGHVRVAADGINFIGPDDYAGKAEPYAAEWVLGRNVVLLADANNVLPNALDLGSPGPPVIPPKREVFYPNTPTGSLPNSTSLPYSGSFVASAGNLSPLGYGSPDATYAGGGVAVAPNQVVQSSRYDLAGTTIEQFRSIITNAANASAGNHPYYFWWAPLVYQQPHDTVSGGVPQIGNLSPSPAAPLATSISHPTVGGGSNNQWFPRYRFQASNVLSPSPMTSQDQANLASYFLEHVSQFIVEYAGDFVTQDSSTGNVTDTVPDGQIDWVCATKGVWTTSASYVPGDIVIDPNAGASANAKYWQAIAPATGASPNGPNWQTVTPPRQIRWYGMPRDVTGSGHVYTANFALPRNPPGHAQANLLNNVVPLSDIWLMSSQNSTRSLPYEVETGATLKPAAPSVDSMTIKDYAYVPPDTTGNPASGTTGMSAYSRYTAVWRNDVPAMVRILIKVDDPNSVLADGPWFEYVFRLK